MMKSKMSYIFPNALKTGIGEGKIIEDVEDLQGRVKSSKVCDRMSVQTGEGCVGGMVGLVYLVKGLIPRSW